MKLLVFVLIVIGVIVGSVSGAGKVACVKCGKCNTGETPATVDSCDFCSTTITNALVTKDCVTGTCVEKTTYEKQVKCCNDKPNCNDPVETVLPTIKPFKCYECKECPNPFPKEGGTQSGAECFACKTTTTADNKIEKKCMKATDTLCAASIDNKKKVECCNADLCNAGVSHSTKKFVLVGLLAMAIGAIRY